MKKNKVGIFIFKVLLVGIVFGFGTLLSKKNDTLKANIYENIYNNYISFAKIKSLYNNNIGSIIPIKKIINDKVVFNESIKYKDISTFNNGVKLEVDNNYSVPIIKDGIVIFIGDKKELNKTVIIEDEDGVDYYYGNLDKINIKLYDYVSKNDLLGSVKDNTLYLAFQKGNEYLDYKKFLK